MSESDGYQLVQSLGSGISGTVYLSDSDNVVVREFSSPSPADSSDWQADRSHFLQGARQASRLTLPGVLHTLEVIEEDGQPFVAVERARGATLASKLAAAQPFSAAETDSIISQLAATLDAAHKLGVIHGDLKPSNVFLEPDGAAKISDFGISPRSRKNRGQLPPQWGHPYLSPEHFLNSQAIDARSDQYALAAIAYELLTGRAPHIGLGSSLRSALASDRTSLSVPTGAVLVRALSQRPEHRFASCSEFAEALRKSHVVTGAATAPVPGLRKLVFGLAGVATLLLAALLLIPTFFSTGRRTSHRETKKEAVARVEHKPNDPDPKLSEGITTPAHPVERNKLHVQKADDVPKKTKPAAMTPVGTSPHPLSADPLRGDDFSGGTQLPTYPQPRDPATLPSPVVPSNPRYEIAVYSRDQKIEQNLSFNFKDPVYGELAQGDLKAVVSAPPTRGKLTLQWTMDGIPLETLSVTPNRTLAYHNEPMPGTYKLVLMHDGKPVTSFLFRIIP